MTISQVIYEKRKELGFTQEQVANYLGVSTPAVNKWEKGTTYPDISQLAPLARLLGTDVNTLLCFKEELTTNEIAQFGMKVMQAYSSKGYDKAYSVAQEKLREYPDNMQLLHNLALMLDGTLMMSGISGENLKKQQDLIFELYERLLQSKNQKDRDSAAFMLASKYINREEFNKAQEMIDLLPEFNAMNKKNLQAHLYSAEKKYQEAEQTHERMMIMDITNVWNHLLSLQELQIQQNNKEAAACIGDICSHFAKDLELPDYFILIPQFMQAVCQQDKEKSITILENIVKTSSDISIQLNKKNSILFKRIQMAPKQGDAQIPSIIPAIISQIESDDKYMFLRDHPKYKELISSNGLS
jgi:transcriptional regulator with XRE-family HTH domain